MQPMTQPVVDLRGRRFGRPTVATGRAQSSAGWITVRSVDARQSGRNSSTIVDGQPMARLVVRTPCGFLFAVADRILLVTIARAAHERSELFVRDRVAGGD